MDELTANCPPGLYRIFLSRLTQQAFNLRADEDVTQEDNVRTISKQAILDDLAAKHGISDFAPVRKLVEDYPEDEITVVYDYEFQYDRNFYICLDTNLKEIIHNVTK